MDDLANLSRAELEALTHGLRRTVIRLQAQARRDTERIDDAESAARVYRRLALRLIDQECQCRSTPEPSES